MEFSCRWDGVAATNRLVTRPIEPPTGRRYQFNQPVSQKRCNNNVVAVVVVVVVVGRNRVRLVPAPIGRSSSNNNSVIDSAKPTPSQTNDGRS